MKLSFSFLILKTEGIIVAPHVLYALTIITCAQKNFLIQREKGTSLPLTFSVQLHAKMTHHHSPPSLGPTALFPSNHLDRVNMSIK